MTQALSYFTPETNRELPIDPGELTWMQQQLNAGARLMYDARRRAATDSISPPRPSSTRMLSGPASFPPPHPRDLPFRTPPTSPWC